ncbi:DUF1631 family protein [Pseudomonas aeruginosa]|uniref:DUF1631 family protein n=2 Tax=Pseudomonas aeruginosa TaxID=287 RepID=UPI0021E42D10|nr:DUF1631 family protein [Pseudomonas aeruginosa]MCV2475126.1 DUF1631 family protein [Pseudomonas aeruginosa]MCV2481011.1 DUF1631 family protein [Pseudomonas aeruginosa]
MQNDANVVHLTRVASEPSPNAGAGRLPVILVQVRDKAALQLKQALQALFDNADDTLFEMADRATSNLEQNAFFEAMRDLRLKRKSIERVYLQKVFEEFSALNQVQSGKSVPTLDTVSFDSLSLVQNEELEESVAVDAMVARVMSRDATALAHLSTRLNTLVGRKVDEKSNPLAPRPLTAAFLDACQGLGVEIKVKLIILKLFEKYVLAHCDQLYAEANQILVAAGVLPELKSALPRRQPAVRPEAVRDAGTLQAQAALLDGGQQEVFGALQELLAQVRDNPSFYRRETPENAAPISSNDLMRLLSHLQQHLPGPGAAEFDVRDGVDQLLQRVSHKSGRSRVVGQVDDDVINLVSMLFEFILDDRTLPDSLKALIGRMQIPMLKVALLDKTFFSRGSHPARRLLNEIASASLGWAEHNDARRDSLYQKIEQVVMRLLNDFVDDPAIFAELLEDFIAFTGDERRRSELLEQRTRDAEEGRAKAELARQDVEQVLNQRLLGKVLPEVVVRLLRDAWSKVMLLICLKHGKASAEWREALDTMDELIWSVGPHDDPLSRQQLLERVPGLLKALLEEAAQASRETLKSLGQLFEDRVIVAETLDTPWTQFYDQVSAAMDKTYQLDDAVLGYLDTQLQKRLQQVRTQMLLLVAALAVVFAAILYLYGGFYVSTRATLKDLGRMMERVAGGDMTVSFQARSRDELGELGQSFNESVAKIHDLIERVSQTVGEVERQTLRVESVSAESNQAVAGQRSQIEQVATAMNQMAATAQEVARSAAMAVSSANSVNQETLSGRSLVESQVGSIQRLAGEIDQSVAAINRLASDSASISQVLDVIKGIAEQTNLLALNAAIEAARAGEQGRGFAVVADEVRTLAKRTQQSTAEIEQMILRLQGGVDAAVKAMGSSHHTADGTVNESAQVQQALENILGAVGMIVDQNQQIAAAAEQQTAVAHDIDQNIVEINQAGERTAEGASQTERASRELGAQVTQLKRLIGAFRV